MIPVTVTVPDGIEIPASGNGTKIQVAGTEWDGTKILVSGTTERNGTEIPVMEQNGTGCAC